MPGSLNNARSRTSARRRRDVQDLGRRGRCAWGTRNPGGKERRPAAAEGRHEGQEGGSGMREQVVRDGIVRPQHGGEHEGGLVDVRQGSGGKKQTTRDRLENPHAAEFLLAVSVDDVSSSVRLQQSCPLCRPGAKQVGTISCRCRGTQPCAASGRSRLPHPPPSRLDFRRGPHRSLPSQPRFFERRRCRRTTFKSTLQ
jgi:hypothetical protein